MFKKIAIIIITIITIFFGLNVANGTCQLGGDIGSSIETCIGTAKVMKTDDLTVEAGFKDLIVSFVNKIGTILAVVAVGSIAYGSMVIVISGGNDEKIKKGRNIIKWSLVGFLILVSAAGIIKLIIYIVYGL
ncbi:hypothetical protein EOM39_04155 [Candidatus Gracilibacteria bacterium]|nr:hypothetical protein [Candidatus Gracilibacteria bacterium]